VYKIGKFIIYGDHEDDPDGLSIKLFPYSGKTYPWWSNSTKKVLEEMFNLPIKGATVLDLGCGSSAILALAAEKLGAAKIIGCEHDSILADMARKQVSGKNIKIIDKDDNIKYDIIIANLGEIEIIEKLKKRSKHGICTSEDDEILRW